MPSKHRLKRMLATTIGIGAALSIASGLPSAIPASAAQRGNTVPQPALTGNSSAAPHATITTRQPRRVRINASTTCYYGFYTRVNLKISGPPNWVAMNTNFCVNGTIVTYHSTTMSHSTPVGTYYPAPIQFRCYVAAGSHTNCSGNQETDYPTVTQIIYPVIYQNSIEIQQSENYHAGEIWYWHVSVIIA
jgi:hypothetical protein